MSDNLDADLDAYSERVKDAGMEFMERVCGTIEDEMAEKLSVAYPPSSSPGDFPARRTGNLRAGLFHTVTRDGEAIRGFVGSERQGGNPNVPVILNNVINRPYVTITHREWQERFVREARNIQVL